MIEFFSFIFRDPPTAWGMGFFILCILLIIEIIVARAIEAFRKK